MMFRRFLIAALALMLSLPGLCQENPSRAIRDSLLFEGRYRTHYLYMPSRLREGRPLPGTLIPWLCAAIRRSEQEEKR